MYAEVDFSPVSKGENGESQEGWMVSPRLFCDQTLGSISSNSCGAGIGFSWTETSRDRNREFQMTLDGESTGMSHRGSLTMQSVRYFDDRNGARKAGANVSSKGALGLSYGLDWNY